MVQIKAQKKILYELSKGAALLLVLSFFMWPYFIGLKTIAKNWQRAATSTPTVTIEMPVEPTSAPSWDQQPVKYTRDNLGINLPWLNRHDGTEVFNWLNTEYNPKLIEKDLADVQSMGVTKIRSWCQVESVFEFKKDKFVLNDTYAANLDDFLDRAQKHKISVICVMGDGHYEDKPQNLDGRLRWSLLRNPEGLQVYTDAYAAYVNRFKKHKNILMWEINNEPYGSLTWSASAKKLGITQTQVHTYLAESYKAIKPIAGDTLVGFSDLEEEEQTKYQLFSSEENRKTLVDDATDVYSMHIYRKDPSQVSDFRGLTDKPKWVVELGSYNYNDPKAIDHPIAASNELYNSDENFNSVILLSRKLINSGFTLVMPWGFTSNDGMVTHNPDGSHSLLKLALYMKAKLTQH